MCVSKDLRGQRYSSLNNAYSQTPIAPMFIKHIQTNIVKQCTEYIWLNTLYVILNVENFSGAISSNKNRITSIKTWHQQIKWRYNPTLVVLWQKCIHNLEETSNNISNLVKPFGTKQLTRYWSQRPNAFRFFIPSGLDSCYFSTDLSKFYFQYLCLACQFSLS